MVAAKTRKRLGVWQFVMSAIPFLLSGYDALDHGKVAFGILNILVALANLASIRFIKKRAAETNIVLMLLNSGVAALVTRDYYLAGKKGLPYAWAAVTVAYFIAAVMVWRKAKQGK